MGELAQDKRDGRGSDRVPQAKGSQEDQAGFQRECHCQPIEQNQGAVIRGKMNDKKPVREGKACRKYINERLFRKYILQKLCRAYVLAIQRAITGGEAAGFQGRARGQGQEGER